MDDITLTERAARRIGEILRREPPGTMLRVLIDQISAGYLAGSEIDFVDDLIGASFRINNPQATASCGCGTSFSL